MTFILFNESFFNWKKFLSWKSEIIFQKNCHFLRKKKHKNLMILFVYNFNCYIHDDLSILIKLQLQYNYIFAENTRWKQLWLHYFNNSKHDGWITTYLDNVELLLWWQKYADVVVKNIEYFHVESHVNRWSGKNFQVSLSYSNW